MSRAKRCEWAGVACLSAVPILFVAYSARGLNDETLGRLLGVPSKVAGALALAFFASWLAAFVGLLFRAGSLKLEVMIQAPEDQGHLRKIKSLRLALVPCLLLCCVAQGFALSIKPPGLGLVPLALAWALFMAVGKRHNKARHEVAARIEQRAEALSHARRA